MYLFHNSYYMKKILSIIFIFLLCFNPNAMAGKKFKDIKGFKKQYLSTPVGKVNRIIEVKKKRWLSSL